MNIDLFLHDLHAYGREHDIPNVTPEVGGWLADMIRAIDARHVLEIGTANGYSTIWMARALAELNATDGESESKRTITTIDFSRPTFDMAQKNVCACGLDAFIEWRFGNAFLYLPDLPDTSYDMVFVDGQKRSTRDFLVHALRIVRSRGVIVVDDVIRFREKMGDVFGWLTEQDIRYTILPIDGDDGVMMIVR